MRVAMLAHSVNPRGGIVHALSLAEALIGQEVEAAVHAPDATLRGFFREARCATRAFPVAPPRANFREMIAQRIEDYVRWFEPAAHRRFDLFHAHDGISANALIELKRRGLIGGFVRTVHHIDEYDDPKIAFWQHRSIAEADALAVVSPMWRERVRETFGREATVVGNGVDVERFSSLPQARDATLRAGWKLEGGPILLTFGGVEARKNTVNLLYAFAQLQNACPDAVLVIAGGATLLDHSRYRLAFEEALSALGSAASRVRVLGPVPDADVPALYRLADVYLSASVREGFGLCVIEALACGKPVVVSRIEPFTGYLKREEAHWCDPDSPASIAAAMRSALRARGSAPDGAARFPWSRVAERHLPIYERLNEVRHA